MIPAQATCLAAPGTPEWAQWQLRYVFEPVDAKAITDCVAHGLVPYASAWRARTMYAGKCHERRWEGWQARLAWACIEAILKPIEDDDIPF